MRPPWATPVRRALTLLGLVIGVGGCSAIESALPGLSADLRRVAKRRVWIEAEARMDARDWPVDLPAAEGAGEAERRKFVAGSQ